MPTLTVIKYFEVIKNIAAGFFPRSVDLFLYLFTLSNWKKLSATALSWQLPLRLILPFRPYDFRNDCPGPSEPAPFFADYAAIQPSAVRSGQMSFVIRDCIDQPIFLRENRSTTTARYSQPRES